MDCKCINPTKIVLISWFLWYSINRFLYNILGRYIMQTFEEQKAYVSKFNVIDDMFFQKMAEDMEVAEEILRIILKKPKLKVI